MPVANDTDSGCASLPHTRNNESAVKDVPQRRDKPRTNRTHIHTYGTTTHLNEGGAKATRVHGRAGALEVPLVAGANFPARTWYETGTCAGTMRDKGGTDVATIHGQTLSVPRPSVLTIVGDALRQVDDVSNVYLCRRTAYCNSAELCAHSYLACQLKQRLGVEQITIGLCTVCIAFLEMNAVAYSNVACCTGGTVRSSFSLAQHGKQ